jgi:hypothetical protein
VVRRITPAQARSKLRQAQQKQRQAINSYNAAVRKYNRDVKRAVDNYNREAAAHNARVRANRQRLKRELARLSSTSTTTRYVVYRRSVVTLQQSFARIEASADAGTWLGGTELLDLSEGETANSVAVLNALLAEPEQQRMPVDASLQTTTITNELTEISPDLDDRWHGALYSLSPNNPDAARHFCTSSREILTTILESEAPDHEVLAANPRAPLTPEGRVTRGARIPYCLDRRGTYDPDLESFVDDDLENVIELFRDFNDGTHGSAGRFDLPQLAAIKKRVEDAILFLHRVVR